MRDGKTMKRFELLEDAKCYTECLLREGLDFMLVGGYAVARVRTKNG